MLQFNNEWRFNSPGELPQGLVNSFTEIIVKIASQVENRKEIYEHFKSNFAATSGRISAYSSNESWAMTDLDIYMSDAAENGALFIEAFYTGCETLRQNRPEIYIPDVNKINQLLHFAGSTYRIEPPHLLFDNDNKPIEVPENPLTLSEQAANLIKKSLEESENLLSQGKERQAIQELLWLLESVSTAFAGLSIGDDTIQGKYFNKIADDLKYKHKGKSLENIINWIRTLHGYLSSPTGGGVRHGTDLKSDLVIQPGEARLYCNLIRSYITFLMSEHERLSKSL